MKYWYYIANNTRNGPVAEDALKTLVTTGVVNGETHVWTEGMGDQWKPLKDIPELCDDQAPVSASATPSVRTILSQRAQGAPPANAQAPQPKRKGKSIGCLLMAAVLMGLAVGVLCLDFVNLAWLVLIGALLAATGLAMRYHEGKDRLEWGYGRLRWATAGMAIVVLGTILFFIGIKGCAAPNREAREELASRIRSMIGGGSRLVDSQPHECARHQAMIVLAKDGLALSQNLSSGTALTPAQVEQLGQFMRGGWPATRCPAGGSYEIGKISEPPRCSIHGRKTP